MAVTILVKDLLCLSSPRKCLVKRRTDAFCVLKGRQSLKKNHFLMVIIFNPDPGNHMGLIKLESWPNGSRDLRTLESSR